MHAKLIRQNFHFTLYGEFLFPLTQEAIIIPLHSFPPSNKAPCETLSLCRQRAKKAMFSYKYPVSRCFLCPQLASFQFPRFFTEEHEKKKKCPPKKKRAYVGKRRRTFYFLLAQLCNELNKYAKGFQRQLIILVAPAEKKINPNRILQNRFWGPT